MRRYVSLTIAAAILLSASAPVFAAKNFRFFRLLNRAYSTARYELCSTQNGQCFETGLLRSYGTVNVRRGEVHMIRFSIPEQKCARHYAVNPDDSVAIESNCHIGRF